MPDPDAPSASPSDSHRDRAASTPVRCAVVIVSDSRSSGDADDHAGPLIRERLSEAGHEVVESSVIPDDPDRIAAIIHTLADSVDVVLLSGGTGVSRRDNTIDVLKPKLETHLPGFGELFRMLSYDEVGSAAMLSRATAGLYRNTFYFALPGSPNAVRLALDELILPELQHLVWETLRDADSS